MTSATQSAAPLALLLALHPLNCCEGRFPLHETFTFTPFMSVKKKAPTILEKKKEGKMQKSISILCGCSTIYHFPNTISNRKRQNRVVIWREKEGTLSWLTMKDDNTSFSLFWIPWLAIPVSILLFSPGAFYYRRYVFLAVFLVFLAGASAQPVFLQLSFLIILWSWMETICSFRISLACFSVSNSTML
jgi:hypothetical protein